MVNRELTEKIKSDFFQGKVIIITGPRQVGKTTLSKFLISEYKDIAEFSGDNIDSASKLKADKESLIKAVGENNIIFIDEAQRIENIGLILKILVDHFGKQKQILVTGSSSLNLLSNTSEPLTGRKNVYEMLGFSLREIFPTMNSFEINNNLENLMIFGAYPEIYLNNDNKGKISRLAEITGSYLFKDILELENIKSPEVLSKLLSALALQIGSEVSYTELSSLIGLDYKTVERYVDLLEKNYIIFRLPPYYTKLRKTLSKKNKIFFCDLGIRNSLINNFNPLDQRTDVGGLWENFLILERMKLRKVKEIYANQFFWRTYDGAEIDLVEEREGKLFGYEFKWGKKRTAPDSWNEVENSELEFINKENFIDFLK